MKKIRNLIFVSIIVKFLIILVSHPIQNFDLVSYKKIGKLTVEQVNIYPYPANIHYPYLPFYLYVEALAYLIKNFIPIDVFLKLINLLFDLGVTYLIFLISKKNSRVTLFYAFNPVTILIFYFHGQFDVVPIFFILLSIYFLEQKKEFFSILFYFFSILIKTWPIFFLIIFFKNIKKKNYFFYGSFFSLLIIFNYILAFKSNLFEILRTITSYRSLFSIWGIGKIIHILFFNYQDQPPLFIQKFLLIIFLISIVLYSLYLNDKKIISNIFHLLLYFFVFTVGFSVQYFSWLIPFLLLEKPKHWWVLNLIITVFLIFNYYEWIVNKPLFLTSVASFFCWLSFLFLFIYWNKKGFILI